MTRSPRILPTIHLHLRTKTTLRQMSKSRTKWILLLKISLMCFQIIKLMNKWKTRLWVSQQWNKNKSWKDLLKLICNRRKVWYQKAQLLLMKLLKWPAWWHLFKIKESMKTQVHTRNLKKQTHRMRLLCLLTISMKPLRRRHKNLK